MKLSTDVIKKMMEAVRKTRDHELTCGHCYDELDRFIEMELSDKNAAEAMPLVKAHLDICRDCREEYEVLLEALQAIIE